MHNIPDFEVAIGVGSEIKIPLDGAKPEAIPFGPRTLPLLMRGSVSADGSTLVLKFDEYSGSRK